MGQTFPQPLQSLRRSFGEEAHEFQEVNNLLRTAERLFGLCTRISALVVVDTHQTEGKFQNAKSLFFVQRNSTLDCVGPPDRAAHSQPRHHSHPTLCPFPGHRAWR